jgi:hypothetical protein
MTPQNRLEQIVDIVDAANNLPDDPRERCHLYARALFDIRRVARGLTTEREDKAAGPLPLGELLTDKEAIGGSITDASVVINAIRAGEVLTENEAGRGAQLIGAYTPERHVSEDVVNELVRRGVISWPAEGKVAFYIHTDVVARQPR